MTLTQLLEATAEVQIIDGRVIGQKVGGRGDAVVVEAVDSTWWDVYAADFDVLRALRAAVPDAEEVPRRTPLPVRSLIGATAARRGRPGRPRAQTVFVGLRLPNNASRPSDIDPTDRRRTSVAP